MERIAQRLGLAAAAAGAALALAAPAGAAMAPALDLDIVRARAVAHSFIVKATQKAGIGLKDVFVQCSEVRPSTPVGPAVVTYFTAGKESDAVVVVRKQGRYKVAGIVPVQSFDCGARWQLAV